MAVTIKDVAAKAGVSPSTVSKVLNHWTTISEDTKARVHQAIKELNYTPNARAVSFARQTTQNIVFLTNLKKDEAYENPHMFDIMCGSYHTLSSHNYTMTLVDISKDETPGDSVAKVIAQKCADGLIIHGSAVNKEIAHLLITEQFPHIIIGHPGFESQLCWVDTNHILAGQTAACHMINCGYTNVAFIGGEKTDVISTQREKGFISAFSDYGIHIKEPYIIHTNSSKEQSYKKAFALLRSDHRPRAIVCENNSIAVGVMNAIKDCNLSVPDEVAFLTFDIYPYSKMIEPTPTVIDINVYDMGVQAGTMLLRKLKNPALQIQSYTTLPVTIVNKTTKQLSD